MNKILFHVCFSCYDKSTCLLWKRLIIKPGNCPETPNPELPWRLQVQWVVTQSTATIVYCVDNSTQVTQSWQIHLCVPEVCVGGCWCCVFFSYSSSLNWIITSWSSRADLLVQLVLYHHAHYPVRRKDLSRIYHVTQLYTKIISLILVWLQALCYQVIELDNG